MRKKHTFDQIVIGGILALLVFLAGTIAVRFFTRQICVEHFQMDNAFTRMVWFDNSEAGGFGGCETDVRVAIDWEKQYPFEGAENETRREGAAAKAAFYADHLDALTVSMEQKIESYATDMLVGYYQWVALAKSYDRRIGWADAKQFLVTDSEEEILFLDNGYLTDAEPVIDKQDIEEIADRVADFHHFLDANGIDFCYVNAGSKVCPYDRQMPDLCCEYSNENGDSLIEALQFRNVDVLDMRACMIADGLDWYDSYYITDHHWKTETGLWAAGVLGRWLNEKSGFSFDDFYFSESSYLLQKYENYFIGSQGRSVTFAEADLEAYTKITPRFDTDFSVWIPEKGMEQSGTYAEVLFQEEAFSGIAEYTKDDFLEKVDAYNCSRLNNEALAVIKNNHARHNRDKKILMLQDSFAWYLTSYLACDAGQIDVIYPPNFTGSIRSYIRQTKPDAVILMLSERNIDPLDMQQCQAHTAMFELE